MKKSLLLLLAILCSYSSFASHGMGGEITWACDGLGNYIFTVKFYRDCNGIPGPASITLSTNVPGVPTIDCPLLSQTDISPDGANGTGNSDCVNCPPVGVGGNGAVEEFVFQSAPTVLPGTPPAAGWFFNWGTCCRSNALNNLPSPSSLGFGLRAKMYPYPGFIADQCHDNSPYFAEKPSTIICTGYVFTYNHNAVDVELDSVVYSWDNPIEDPATTPYPWTPNIPWQAPYSMNNQLPGTPTLNIHSGELTYNPATGGYFATVIKATAYKCGVVAAEIWREINVILISGCTIPVTGNPLNYPPNVQPPFTDSLGVPRYDTTVYAGDTVNFNFIASDFDIYPPANLQTVTLNASGLEYGAGFTSTTTGCIIAPCATLSPAPPVSTMAFANTVFNWTTTTAHLGIGLGCVYFGNRYYFIVKAQDNYCPANAISNATIAITVLPNTPAPLVTWGNGELTCLTTGNYSYQWFLNRYAIGGATSQSYTPLTNGFYQVLAMHNVTGDGNYSEGIILTNVGMEVIQSISNLVIYPNPSRNGIFQLSFASAKEENIVISIKDIPGKSLTEKSLHNFTGKYSEEINLSSFSKGIYTVEIKTAEGTINKKLILL